MASGESTVLWEIKQGFSGSFPGDDVSALCIIAASFQTHRDVGKLFSMPLLFF